MEYFTKQQLLLVLSYLIHLYRKKYNSAPATNYIQYNYVTKNMRNECRDLKNTMGNSDTWKSILKQAKKWDRNINAKKIYL